MVAVILESPAEHSLRSPNQSRQKKQGSATKQQTLPDRFFETLRQTPNFSVFGPFSVLIFCGFRLSIRSFAVTPTFAICDVVRRLVTSLADRAMRTSRSAKHSLCFRPDRPALGRWANPSYRISTQCLLSDRIIHVAGYRSFSVGSNQLPQCLVILSSICNAFA